jgi:hypothetical protein
MERDPASGSSSHASSTGATLRASSSRTSRMARAAGFRRSSETSKRSATFRLPSRFLPQPSELRICVLEPSSLPTPTASSYGSSNNGDPHDHREAYATKGKPSIWTMAKRGELPLHPAGPLLPQWVEWAMGFPDDWTEIPSRQIGIAF